MHTLLCTITSCNQRDCPRDLSYEDDFFSAMITLRLDLPEKDLHHRFRLSSTSDVSTILKDLDQLACRQVGQVHCVVNKRAGPENGKGKKKALLCCIKTYHCLVTGCCNCEQKRANDGHFLLYRLPHSTLLLTSLTSVTVWLQCEEFAAILCETSTVSQHFTFSYASNFTVRTTKIFTV